MSKIDKLFNKLHKLQDISSTNSKKQFIKANSDDKLFISTLEFLLNPYKVTNISKKKIEKEVKVEPYIVPAGLNSLFVYLTQECTGKDINVASIQEFINRHKEFEDDIKELVTKSMKLGVKAKLVNDALGYDLVPDFGCMLGESYAKNENKVKGSFILSTKLDGSRILILKEKGNVRCFSRQGQLIEGLDEIVLDVENMDFDNGVLDGELLAIGEFKDNSEQYKETMKRSRIKGIKSGLKVVAYDYIEDINNFYKGRDNTPCRERKIKLCKLIKKSNCEYVEYLSNLYEGTDKYVINEELIKATSRNEEGLMLNISNAPYECKRSKGLLKIKKFSHADMLCYDVFEGEGSMVGMLGGIKLKGLYGDDIVYTDCGSGFTQEERIYFWKNKSELIDKIITVKFFEVSENSKTKIKSLRFCTWCGSEYIRNDKSGLESTNID